MQTRRLLVWLILAAPAPAQRLYNADQDRRAQEALKAGKEITPGAGFQSALDNFHEELAIYKSFAERDPQNLQAREDLSGAYYDVGDTLVKMGKFSEGLATIRRAIALDKQLMSADPKRAVLRSNLAQHRVAEAETLNKMGDAAGALQSYKEARGFYQGLALLDDHNLDARLNVSATDAKIAATLFRLGQFDERSSFHLV